MSARPGQPAMFVGSSVEGLAVAYAIQECLEYAAEPTVWSQGVFKPTSNTLAALLEEVRRTKFAVFVFTPDDISQMRRETHHVPRDNVVFELGLFMGALDPIRCFVVMPRDTPSLHLPSDLLGIAALTYDAARSDGRLVAALGPACNRIRSAIRSHAPYSPTHVETAELRSMHRLGDYLEAWKGDEFADARARLRRGIPLHAVEDENGDDTRAMRKVFAFLESLSDAILAGEIDESRARKTFEDPVRDVWRRAYTYLAPLNGADEVWNPLPRIAQLADRWETQP